METMAVRPLDAEVLLDEICPVAIHSLSKLNRFLLAVSIFLQSAHLALKRSVDKHVKGVRASFKIIGRTASHDYAVALVRGGFHDFFRNLTDAIRVHDFQPRSVQTSFIAAAHKSPKEPIEDWIELLFTLLYRAAVAIQQPGDFVGQQLIPQLPT